jgi:predicted nuclease of restriction endonuclease-like (RecB) superfamily
MMASKVNKPAPQPAPLYERVREILGAARANIARTVNTTQVVANWLVGREIVEDEQAGKRRARYGAAVLAELAVRLKAEFGGGYGVDNLELCRRFYLEYPALLTHANSDLVRRNSGREIVVPAISDAVRRKSGASQPPTFTSAVGEEAPWQPGVLHAGLSWTHYRRLLRVGRSQARSFYEIEATKNAWNARELERQVASLLYDRLAKSRDKKGLMRLAVNGQEVTQPLDVLKDPLVLEFLDLPHSPRLVESKLEQALIGNLQVFLQELGKGFAFISRQERITLDGDHFYIDLVFYHAILKCYVLIELKVGKLTHADLGQIQFYVNYFDRERRTEGDNPTIGLILCSDKNDAVVRYTLGEQLERNIFTSRYQLHLPTVEELESEILRELRHLLPAFPGSPDLAIKKPAPARKKSASGNGNKKGKNE